MSEPVPTPAPNVCAQCQMPAQDEWRVRGAILRMEMRRHDLTFRELQIAEVILDKTYGWQRKEIVFPQLSFFTDYTGISDSDVVKVLKSLHARRVIRIVTAKGRPNYSINADTEAWKALPRVSKATMQRTMNVMREQNGLEPLHLEQEAALNFKNGAHTKIFDAEIGKLPMLPPTAQHTDDFPDFL